MDGWGIVAGDKIQLGGQTATARITSINYSTNALTLDTSLAWTSGQGVSLSYSGSAPDIGAFEFNSDTVPEPIPIPEPTPTDIRADVNQDSSINTTDALLTLRKSIGLNMSSTGWKDSDTTGDVNCDNRTTTSDAVLILRYSLGFNMSETEWCS